MGIQINKKTDFKNSMRNIYICFIVVYMIVREVLPLYFVVDNLLLSAVIFLGGFALILWDLFTDRECLQGKTVDFFVAFLLISIISSVINYKYGVAANIKCIAAMVLEYFVFFPMGFKKDAAKTLRLVLNTLIIALAPFILISLGMYFFSVDYSVFQEYIRDQGFDMQWGRLWGIFNDPNMICYISLVSVFASGYLMYYYKKVWVYVLYGIDSILKITFIMLVISKSIQIMLLIVPILASAYPLIAYYKTNKKRAFGSVMFSVSLIAVLVGCYYGLEQGIPYIKATLLNNIRMEAREKVVTAYDRFYQACGMKILNIDDNHIIIDPNDPDSENNVKVEVEKIERKDQKDDYSNGRFARWKGGIEIFKTTPIIGTSPRNAIAMAQAKQQDTVMGKYGWVTHCSYLEVLVNTGILGSIAMFGCLLYIAALFIKAALKKGFDVHVYIAFLCFVTIAIGAFFISDVFFVFTFNALLFFFLLGYLYGYCDGSQESIMYRICNSILKKKAKQVCG